MIINYELYGRSFFHSDCKEGFNHCGIVKPIKNEKDKTLVECQNCGKRGYYPVGKKGCIHSDVVSIAKVSDEEYEWECPECSNRGDYADIRKPVDSGADKCPQCSTPVICVD